MMNNKGSIALITILATALLGGLAFLARGGVQQPTNEPTLGKFNDPFIEVQGGTGTSTYVTGDLLYADGANTLGSLPVGSAGQVLKVSGGVPSWGTDAGGSGASSWEVAGTNLLTPTNTLAGIIVRGSSTIDNNLRVTGSLNSTSTVTDSLKIGSDSAITDITGTGLSVSTGSLTVSLSPFSTTNLSEGSNLYYTDERVDDRVSALIQNGTNLTWTYVDGSNTLTGNVTGLAPSGFQGAWHELLPNMLAPTNTTAGIIVRASSTFDGPLRIATSLNATSTVTDNLKVLTGGSVSLPNDSITDAMVVDTLTASNYVRKNTWTDHDNYPTGCSAGNYVQTVGDTLTCAADVTGAGQNGIWEVFATNVIRPTNTSAAILVNAASSTVTNIVSDKATSSALVVGKANYPTINMIDGDFKALRATTSNLTVTSLNSSNCDLKADTSGNFYCGTDASGSASGAPGAWETVFTNALRPTNTSAGIFVQASSTIDANLRVTGSVNATSSNIDSLAVNTSITVPDNSFALGTKTTGNYVATIADDGQSTITVNNSGSETAGITLRVIDVVCTDCLGATEIADSYLLNNGDTGTGSYIFSGDARIASLNASSTNVGTLNAFTGATTTNLAVTTMTAANCDVKASTGGDFYCGTDATAAGAPAGFNGAWETFASNVIRPTNTSAAILVNAASSTITQLVSNNATISTLNSTSTNIGTLVVYTGSTLPANDITDAEVSDTLTASDLQAASAVVADSEVVDALTINTSIEAIYTGNIRSNHINATSTNVGTLTGYGLATLPDLRASMLNSTTTNVGTLNVFTQSSLAKATATNFAVTTLTAANCDVKASTIGDFYCGTDATAAGAPAGFNGAWEAFSANVLRPTNTTAAILINSASSTITRLNSNGATISDLNATTTQVGTLTVYTGSTFPANDIVDAEVSDTLTASDLVAGSAVVADSEVVDALTINTSIEGIMSGGLRATPINSTSTNIGTLMVYGGATSTNLAVLGMTAANCDVKATTAGTFYCGTDAGGAGSDMNSWESFGTNVLRPTNTAASILVNVATSTITNLTMNNATSTGNFVVGTSVWQAPTSSLSILGGLHVFNSVATSSEAVWIGSGGVANGINLQGGDLYVQGDVEIDGVLGTTGSRVSEAYFDTVDTNNITIGGDTISEFAGSGLTVSGNALTVTGKAPLGVNGAWETLAANILRPTNTTAAIIVNSATSTITNLKMNNSTTTDFGIFGTSALAAPTNTVSIIGNSFIQGRSTSTATSTVGGFRVTDDEGAVQHGVEIIPGATTTLRFY